MTERTIHEGRNVKRIREILGIKQDALALDLGLSQQAVSALEQKEALDKDILVKIAGVLKVPTDAIKNFSDETAINVISSTFNDNAAIVNNNCTFNPLDKYVEQVEKNEKLYEALLKSEKEKNELLMKMLEKK
jgi:transcriptional regulator with XRE-family HTH domain